MGLYRERRRGRRRSPDIVCTRESRKFQKKKPKGRGGCMKKILISEGKRTIGREKNIRNMDY